MTDPTRLDLAELVAQTMILPIYGSSPTTVSSDQRAANQSIYGVGTAADVIAKLRPGGILLLDRIPFHPQYGQLPLGSLGQSARLTDFTAGLQSIAEQEGMPTLLVVADQEGGRINRLPVAPLPAPAAVARAGRLDLAERAGRLIGLAARQHGVNVVLGPVADIVTPRGRPNPAIGDRSFGSDPAAVARMVAATVTGIQSTGAASTVKHWPGHGRASADSHVELPSSMSLDTIGVRTRRSRSRQPSTPE